MSREASIIIALLLVGLLLAPGVVFFAYKILMADTPSENITVVVEHPEEPEHSEQTTDLELQEQAVFALSQLSREKAVPALIDIAREHHHPEIREKAIFWLGQEGGADVEAFFQDVLVSNAVTIEEQEQVVFAISQFSRSRSVPMLIEIAKEHEHQEIREKAVFWLGEAGGEQATQALLEMASGE